MSLGCILRVAPFLGLLMIFAIEAEAGPILAGSGVIEKRAACITHEGADLPSGGVTASGPPPRPEAGCPGKDLDGTVCDDLDEVEAGRCRAREIAIWDGVLDHLVRLVVGTRRAALTKDAISAFRSFRDRACAAYRTVAVNPGGPASVAACRLSETVRFTQRIYDAVHTP